MQWAEQGVLLLNVCLTVRAHQANSHAKQGWEPFTDAAISALNRKKRNVVFLLWGKSAELKAKGVDRARHHVLTAAHPSGLSANRVRFKMTEYHLVRFVHVVIAFSWPLFVATRHCCTTSVLLICMAAVTACAHFLTAYGMNAIANKSDLDALQLSVSYIHAGRVSLPVLCVPVLPFHCYDQI